jgi:hypothetical protein
MAREAQKAHCSRQPLAGSRVAKLHRLSVDPDRVSQPLSQERLVALRSEERTVVIRRRSKLVGINFRIRKRGSVVSH